MTTLERGAQRAPFLHSSDCLVEFLGRADNKGAYADVFRVTASGDVYEFQMMKMRHKGDSHPWVFGSFKYQGRQVWSFKNDIRAQQKPDGWRGDVYTHPHEGRTYALFIDSAGVLDYIVPFIEMLADPSVDPDSDAYIATYGDLYDEMREIAQELNLVLPEDVLEVLQKDEDDIDALV